MRAQILCVGSELLLGQIIDSNAAFLGRELAALGIDLHRKVTVGDNLERITHAIEEALSNADALLVTGGLGPTSDDLTREAIARALGLELEFRPELEDQLRAFFEHRGIQVRESFLRQAQLPNGARAIDNSCGSAPGVLWEGAWRDREVLIAAMPGVPREMKSMWHETIALRLSQKSGGGANVIRSRVLRSFGVGESALADPIEDLLKNSTNPTVAPLLHGDTEVHLRLTAKADSSEKAGELLDELEDRLRERIGAHLFGRDDQSMPQVVVDALSARGATLSVAESLTGGGLGALLTEATGCSVVFKGGLTAYAPSLKQNVLGVSEADVDMHSVVSASIAVQMAQGAQKLMDTTFALSTTGEAGPESATGKAVGTVFLGLALPDGTTTVEERRFHGDRDAIRARAAMAALDMLRRWMRDNYG